MQERKIRHITLRDPSGSLIYTPVAALQAVQRWCFQLLSNGFVLPDLDLLRITLVEDKNEEEPRVELQSKPVIDPTFPEYSYLEVFCYFSGFSSPERSPELITDEIVKKTVGLFKHVGNNAQAIEKAADTIGRNGVNTLYCFKSLKYKDLKIGLFARCCGKYPFGGELYFITTDQNLVLKSTHEFLQFGDFRDITNSLAKIRVVGDCVVISAYKKSSAFDDDLIIPIDDLLIDDCRPIPIPDSLASYLRSYEIPAFP